jgi:type II secretory pathway pseudopilin PulG
MKKKTLVRVVAALGVIALLGGALLPAFSSF